MALNNNPFYLLRLSCSAGRREIVSAAEEMSFMLDSEICQAAQNELINLNKRLSAEINWFIDTDQSTVEIIRSNIENKEPISTDGLSPLSTLNATVYNFSLSTDLDPFALGYSIMDIDEKFSAVSADNIIDIINQNRTAAKLGTVQTQEVSAELNKRREEIRQLITEKLSRLDQDTYIELITMLAEKCLADETYDDGVVISDVIDQYEVRMQATLEESTEAIEKHIDKIRIATHSDLIPGEINVLIGEVKRWDKLAQPLQLKSQASGMPHQISERLGNKLRNLSLWLHNDKQLTKEALTLVTAMKSVFAELGELSDKFETDSGTLKDLLKGQKEAKEIVDELDSIQKDSESIKSYASESKVTDFIVRIRKLNSRLKAMDLDFTTKTKVRENLCLLGRGTAIDLHNNHHQTAYALSISKALVKEFSDLTSLRAKLNEDVNALNQQLLLAGLNRSTPSYASSATRSKKSSKGGWIVMLIIVAIIAIAGISSNNKSSSRSSSSYSRTSTSSSSGSTTRPTTKPTAKPTARTEKLYSTASAVGDYVYVNVTLIEPEYGVYMSEVGKAVKSYTKYDDFICKCTTDTGKTVWISFDASSYRSKIDSSVDTYVTTTASGFNGDIVRYSPAAKVHGRVVRSTSVMSGLDTKINQDSIIEYSSIDIPTQTLGQKITISIKSIFPSYTITSGSTNKVTHVLCEYTDSLGKKNWIYMSVSDYKKYFDSTANPATDTYANEKKFSIAKKVTVTTEYADDLINGASNTIGQKTVYVFSIVN